MDTFARLKNVPLFQSVAADHLARVAGLATRQFYPKGSLLCHQDDFGEALYIIDSGEAIVRQTDLRGIERPVGYLREGASFGEDALFLGEAYGSCVQATTPVHALRIRKQDFDSLLEEHRPIRRQLTVNRLIRERLAVPTFTFQSKDESSLLLRRRHWIVLVRALSLPLLILLVLTLVAWLLHRLGILTSPSASLLFVGAVPAILGLWHYIDWRNDFYLVTTEGIIRRERVILTYETRKVALLVKIQDIRITHGFLGHMLGYGTMRIETGSARGTLMLDHVPDPAGMQEIIFRRASYLKSRLRQADQQEIRQELLRQTGQAQDEQEPLIPTPPIQERPKRPGLLAHFLPSRPLFRLRYEQADQIVWRKHWIFLLKRIYLALPATLLVTAVVAFSTYQWVTQRDSSLLIASLILWILAAFWLWWELEDWRNDIYIVTDRLIIDVEKKPFFFAEDRRQAALDMIQNVSLNVPSPLATILNYGDVLIETAGPTGALTFDGVSRPGEVQTEIFRRIEAFSEAQRRREREQKKAELSTWFQVYHELNLPGDAAGPG